VLPNGLDEPKRLVSGESADDLAEHPTQLVNLSS
jgi:hypothetical protein